MGDWRAAATRTPTKRCSPGTGNLPGNSGSSRAAEQQEYPACAAPDSVGLCDCPVGRVLRCVRTSSQSAAPGQEAFQDAQQLIRRT